MRYFEPYALVGALAVTLLAACTSFGASPVVPPAEEPDASAASKPPDAGQSPDAATSPCATSHLFCDDFEAGRFNGWRDTFAGASVAAQGSGHVFVSQIEDSDDPRRRAAALAVLGSPSNLVISFDATVLDSNNGAKSNSRIFEVRAIMTSGAVLGIGLWVSEGLSLQLNTSIRGGLTAGANFAMAGGKRHFELAVSFGPTGLAELKIDGVPKTTASARLEAPLQMVELELGLHAPNGRTPIVRTDFDDVFADEKR